MADRLEPPSPSRPRVALALQGGGAHGAYGWGVIERLLEEDIELVGVSGASAGAINGAALVAGYAAEGPAGARATLERLWRHVADASPLAPLDVGSLGAPFSSRCCAARWISPSSPAAMSRPSCRTCAT